MKKSIHPKYYDEAVITCSCGNEIKTGSTVKQIHIEVCSACHPYYTGKHKLIDAAGRVDAFKKRMKKAEEAEVEKVKIQKKQVANKANKEAKERDPDREIKLG